MYDIAYQIELSICVAEIEREKVWNKILSAPLSCSAMVEFLELGRWRSVLDYATIFLCTHGV